MKIGDAVMVNRRVGRPLKLPWKGFLSVCYENPYNSALLVTKVRKIYKNGNLGTKDIEVWFRDIDVIA